MTQRVTKGQYSTLQTLQKSGSGVTKASYSISVPTAKGSILASSSFVSALVPISTAPKVPAFSVPIIGSL